ncbi:MAG: HAD-IC family P-type ATPase [Sedimentibacter sp.]|uniref:HAD-IC family P-type ATPase n=1 Tax=Sedimentibacter sp. TaxID=1960295 RepID=UPI002981CAE2|nr:HAD-IC family P-type ATPase [Sedimentibacter sp.]MDW5299162.1 HAD-IC family P-type ATPase [Sedimentibacter sp.]
MEIVNYFPGRVRLKINSLYKNKELTQIVKIYICELDGIKKAKANAVTGTIALEYDSNKLNINTIRDTILGIIRNDMYLKYVKEQYSSYLEEEEKFQAAKKKMLIFGSIYILYKVKQHFFGKFFINRNLSVLQAAALVTLIKGYPQLKNTYKKVMTYFPTDADKLLLVTGTLLTLSREGNKGTMLLFLKAFTDALQSFSKLQIERTLIESNIGDNSFVWYNHNEEEFLIPLKSLEQDDEVTFYDNETILVDGTVIEGYALVNNIYYSGQPELKKISYNDNVHEGMIVVSGKIKVKVNNVPKKIFKADVLLNNLEITKGVKRYQQRSIYYASTLALGSFVITGNSLAPLSVFLLMTPSATNVALNSGLANYLKLLMRNKIMLRNINTIEKIIHSRSIVFDKTGTLTNGILKIDDIEIYNNSYTPEEVLKIAALCEGNIYHPVSSALKNSANTNDILNTDTVYIPSKGILADYNNHRVIIGNENMMLDENIDIISAANFVNKENDYYIPIYFAIDNKLTARIIMTEEIENHAKEAIQQLKNSGFSDISIISGDLERNTLNIANKLNISNYEGNLSITDKQNVIYNKKLDETVIMVGDGINDSLAMKEADVSISFINNAYEETLLKSDCILLEKDLILIPKLINITENSYYRIQRNIDFSKNYNIAFGLLAMFGYYGPFSAKSLNTLNSIIAIINSSRISAKPTKIHNKNEVINYEIV